jgi:hypothetical protein
MKQSSVLLLLLLLSQVAFCQKKGKEIHFIFDTSYNLNAVTMNSTEFEGKILKVSISDTLSHLKIAEFVRISDSTYFYQSYNSTGKTIAEGKAALDKTPFEKIKIPVFNPTGEEISFRYWSYYKFHKSGKWYEEVNDSIDRNGGYVNNKKNGDWLYTKFIAKDKGIPFKKEVYNNDALLRTESVNLLEGTLSTISKEVKGKWEIRDASSMWFLDTIIYYFKVPLNETPNYKNHITINPDGKGAIIIGGHHASKKNDFTWRFIERDKKIIITIPDMHSKCTITFLSKEMLVAIFSELNE